MGLLSWPVIHLMIYYLPVQSIQLIFDKKGILLQPGSHLHACVYKFQHNVNRKHELSRNPSGNRVILIFSGQKPCTRII